MLKHQSGSSNPKRYELLNFANMRFSNDGLSNVHYNLIKIDTYRMFTHVLIDVGQKNISNNIINASKLRSTTSSSILSTKIEYYSSAANENYSNKTLTLL
jgi:hypothetical protein